MKLIEKIEKSFDFWFLLFLSFGFFLLRLPSLFEPYWYGDEGIYQVVGLAINRGSLLYRDIWDNKPPLLYLLYALLNSDQTLARLVSLIFGVAASITFYFLAKKLFPTKEKYSKPVVISTILFSLLFAFPIIEGNIANAENFMLLPIILAGLIVFNSITEKNDKKNLRFLLLAGLLLGISFLFKIVGIFDAVAFGTFIFISKTPSFKKIFNKNYLISTYKFLFPYKLGFLIPVLVTFIYFTINNSLGIFIKAVFLSNVSYVGYGNKFIIPQGFLILKVLILIFFVGIVYLRRKSLGKNLTFVLIWLFFSVFNAFFSQRPYTHYLLVLLPSISLLVGYLVYERKKRPFIFLVLTVSLFLIFNTFILGGRNLPYYKNFIGFISSKKTVDEYRAFFDKKTPIDYQIADYINTHTNQNDQIFIWGNNAQVYKLTNKIPPGRYIVAYHITQYRDGFSDTQKALSLKRPKFIIFMEYENYYPFSLADYHETMTVVGAQIYERNN